MEVIVCFQYVCGFIVLIFLQIHLTIIFQQVMSDQFCYWDVKNQTDAIIIVILLAALLVIFVVTLLRIRESNKYRHHASIARIYLLIAFWALVLTSQFLYAISVYFFKIREEDPNTIDMNAYSRAYTRIDIIPGFVVQTLFLQICKLYYKGLTNAIQIKFIQLLRGYCLVRIFNQSVGILLVNIFSESDQIQLFLQINILILVVDCFIINIFLFLSLRIFIVRFSESGRLYQSDLNQLKQQYSIMIITSGLRIVIDVIFLIFPMVDKSAVKECIGQPDVMRTIFYNCVANMINHVLPVIWFLKIYSFSSLESRYNRKSLDESGNLIKSMLQE